MTKDEALKLALEALKQIDGAMPFPVAKLAQAAIKEALAQPEHDKTDVRCECCGYMTYHREHLGCIRAAKLKEPEQEPVAYGMWDTMIGYGGRMMMVRLDKGQDGCTVPLYTTPPPCPTCEALARTVMLDQTGRDA